MEVGWALDPYPTKDVDPAIYIEDSMEDEWETWDSIPLALYDEGDQNWYDEVWITIEEEQHLSEILGRGGGPYQTTWIEEDDGALEEIVLEGCRYEENIKHAATSISIERNQDIATVQTQIRESVLNTNHLDHLVGFLEKGESIQNLRGNLQPIAEGPSIQEDTRRYQMLEKICWLKLAGIRYKREGRKHLIMVSSQKDRVRLRARNEKGLKLNNWDKLIETLSPSAPSMADPLLRRQRTRKAKDQESLVILFTQNVFDPGGKDKNGFQAPLLLTTFFLANTSCPFFRYNLVVGV